MDKDSSIVINEPVLLRMYPQLRELPNNHIQIVVLTIAGLSPTTISEIVGVTRPTVYNVLEKYNIKGIISDSIELQRMLLANSIGTLAVEALAALGQKKDAFKAMSPTVLLAFIKDSLGLADAIRPKRTEAAKTPKELIQSLKEENGTHSQP